MNQDLKTHYFKKLRSDLQKQLGLDNLEAVPKLTKITINTSSSDFKTDAELVKKTKSWLSDITGQAPQETKARQSIAGFNVRQGDVVGLRVTLRGRRMYDFYSKLVNIVLPRIKDFQGVGRTHFDTRGNYTLGLKEQIVFPEVEYDKISRVQGLEITINTSALDREKSLILLSSLGMPFEKVEEATK